MIGVEWELLLEDGGKLTGTRFGTGTRIVLLLHGRNFDQTSWHDVAEELAEDGLTAIAVDFRGYGKSSELPPGETHGRDAARAVQGLRRDGAGDVCLLGGSMGGAAALEAVALQGAQASRVATLSPAVDADEVAPHMPQVPTLLLASRDEPYVDAATFQALSPHPVEIHLYPGDAHNQALLRGPHGADVRARLRQFLTADLEG